MAYNGQGFQQWDFLIIFLRHIKNWQLSSNDPKLILLSVNKKINELDVSNSWISHK